MYAVTIAPNSDHPHVAVARKEAGIPSKDDGRYLEYEELNDVISKIRAPAVPEHGPQDLTIDLIEGNEPPSGPIYNFLAEELETLRDD